MLQAAVLSGRFMRGPFDVHFELSQRCRWRDLELDPQSTITANVVSKAENGLGRLRITSEGNRPFIYGNFSRIANDVSFIIKVIGASLVHSRFPIDNHEIVMRERAVFRGGRVVRVTFANDDLLLQVKSERECAGASTRRALPFRHPSAH